MPRFRSRHQTFVDPANQELASLRDQMNRLARQSLELVEQRSRQDRTSRFAAGVAAEIGKFARAREQWLRVLAALDRVEPLPETELLKPQPPPNPSKK